jgi:hypothetical protein
MNPVRILVVLAAISFVATGCGSAETQTRSARTAVRAHTDERTAPHREKSKQLPASSSAKRRHSAKPPAIPAGLASVVLNSPGVREGLVVAPLDSSAIRVFGAVGAPHAWSTIKPAIVVAVAEARRSGALGPPHRMTTSERELTARAIEDSDNQAAESLFNELGDTGEATAAVQRVLRRSGDRRTVVNSRLTRPGFSTYGQTKWPMSEAARFYRALANGCLTDGVSTKVVLDAMANIGSAGGSEWGLAPAGFTPLRFKDGLGPESGLSDYTAEQYGIVGDAASGGYVIGLVSETDSPADVAYGSATELARRAEARLRGFNSRGGSPGPDRRRGIHGRLCGRSRGRGRSRPSP